MIKTLTDIGLEKLPRRWADALDHANYLHNGEAAEIPILNKIISEDTLKVYVYFDDTIFGSIGQVELVDVDGDVVARQDSEFVKADDKGFYVAFKYKFAEEEVDSVEAL